MQAQAGDERREAVWLPFGRVVARDVELPARAELRAGVAGAAPGRVRLAVSVSRPSPWPWQRPVRLERTLDLAPGEWTAVRLPLAGAPTGRARVSLEAFPVGPAPACLGGLALGQPTFVAEEVRPARPNLVLVSVDTLRADRGAASMPRLAAWGRARATRFEEARSVAPWTLPAHASMLSGLSPLRHGANWPFVPLSADVPLVARQLRQAGWATAAAVGGGWLEPAWGLARGFERHRSWGRRGRGDEEWGSHSELAGRWLDELPQPFFLFLHTFDVHDFPRREKLEGQAGDARRRELYDQAVAHVDAGLGPLLERLAQPPWRDTTVVIVTADHGEALGEGGVHGHGALREEVLRVPLLLALPGQPGGNRDGRPAQTPDVAATLLDLAGLRAPVPLDGRSLRAPAGTAPALAYFPFEGQGLAVLSGRRLYRVDDSAFAAGPGREACFDLSSEAGEKPAEPAECAGLRAEARSRLSGAPPGWSLRLERGAGAATELQLAGRTVTPRQARGWSDGGPLLEAVGPHAARVRWPAENRLELTLAAVPDAPLTLSAGGRALELDPARLSLPAGRGFAAGSWSARAPGPCPPAWLCVELAPQGEFSAPPARPADDALRERLRALGYVN